MKRPVSKILVMIMISNLMMFISAFAIVNIMIPRRFESDARKTIESETLAIGKDSLPEQTYLSGSVQFIYPEDMIKDTVETYSTSFLKDYLKTRNLEKKEILEHLRELKPEFDTCYEYESENGKYLFAVLKEWPQSEPEPPFVIYINIKPFFRYNFLWNLILFVLLLFISAIVFCIGSKLSSEINESQEAERRFFQNTSHELKTPLMAIQGYAEGICAGIEDPVNASRIILEENEKMTKLIREFLFISQLDSRRFQMKTEKTDAREIVYDSLHLIESAARSKDISLQPEVPKEAIYICCDEEQTIKALVNILSNAVSYAASKVTVTCTAKDRFINIEISDDGKGISEKDLPHIFERYYTTRKGGTGIGLSLAREIIALQKGELTARNNAGCGSVFTIKMPRAG